MFSKRQNNFNYKEYFLKAGKQIFPKHDQRGLYLVTAITGVVPPIGSAVAVTVTRLFVALTETV